MYRSVSTIVGDQVGILGAVVLPPFAYGIDPMNEAVSRRRYPCRYLHLLLLSKSHNHTVLVTAQTLQALPRDALLFSSPSPLTLLYFAPLRLCFQFCDPARCRCQPSPSVRGTKLRAPTTLLANAPTFASATTTSGLNSTPKHCSTSATIRLACFSSMMTKSSGSGPVRSSPPSPAPLGDTEAAAAERLICADKTLSAGEVERADSLAVGPPNGLVGADMVSPDMAGREAVDMDLEVEAEDMDRTRRGRRVGS